MFVSKRLSYAFVAVCAMFLSVGTMLAQNINVTGKVTDKNGEPIVGAYVLIDGTQTGATTDIDGVYKLSAPAKGALVFSCVGYKDNKVSVNSRATINVTLSDDAEMLENAVVVGFGTQKKANLTGAVASIDAEKTLDSRPIPDIGRGLQGAAPGLNVRIGTTDVGSEAVIRIRGQVGSYNGSSAPLILLDNVEIPSLNVVNPDDIESVSVLKDAASASIYGAKAAFGVILINSKKGADKDKVHVTYSGNVAVQSLAKALETGGVDGLFYTVQAFERSGGTVAGYPWYVTRASYNAAKDWQAKYGKNGTTPLDANAPLTYGRDYYYDGSRIYGVRTYNAADYMVKDYAPTTTHNVTVAGNKGNTTFNVALGYMYQSGMSKASKEDSYTRWNANVRVNTQITKWLDVRAGLMFTKGTKKYAYNTAVGNADPWYYLYRWSDIIPQMEQDGYGNYLRSPAGEQAMANTATHDNFFTSITGGATVTPVKNWNINVDYTYDVTNVYQIRPGTRFYACDTWSAPAKVDGSMIANEWAEYNGLGSSIQEYKYSPIMYTSAASGIDHIYQTSSKAERNTWNITTTYDLEVAKNHQFMFMLGMNSVGYSYNSFWAQKMGLMDYTNPQFALATGTMTDGGSASWNSTLGFFGRLNYNFKERYLIEANVRYDGSSKFPTALKWRWFPSASAGWRVSEEPWMAEAKDVLSLFKLRGSYGMIGDQTVASSLYIPTMSGSTTTWIHDGAKVTSYGTPAAVSPEITWQDVYTLDFGADITLFHQFNITFDWFQRDTKNMIVPGPGVGYTFGTTSPSGNYGSLRTNGWELALNWGKKFESGFGINISASVADALTKVTEYGAATSISGWYNGKTYGEIWGFQSDGLFQNEDFARQDGKLVIVEATDPSNPAEYKYRHYQFADGKNYALQGKYNASSSVMFGPGDTRYLDQDGNGYIDTGASLIDDHGDLVVIGNTTPRYEYTFKINLDYKGFDFSVFFQGVGKRDMWGSSSLTLAGFNSSDGATTKTFATNFWYEEFDAAGNVIDSNYDAFYPRAYNLGNGTDAFSMKVSDRYLLNMAYLRMKNVTLGYTMPVKVTRKANLEKVRFYVSLENFLTFDHLNGLPVDPEVITGTSALLSSGYNSSRSGVSTPAFKTASFGVQLSF